ncbi:MAG: N-acetylmuramoyl-L-alanine amidase [Thermoanaerobaculia bacterium]
MRQGSDTGPRTRRWRTAWLLAGLCALPVMAQEAQPQEAVPLPVGNAGLVLAGKTGFTVPFTLTPSGPRFALAPIAAALGIELRIGPMGDSHTLLFSDRTFLVGPDEALMVAVPADGDEKIVPLSGLPFRDAQGLKVPLDFLERTFGEQLNYQFTWDSELLKLTISPPEPRELDGAISLRHDFGFSFVEIEFSERPRYRVQHEPGALIIQLMGDRLRSPQHRRNLDDPLVSAIIAEQDTIRIELRPRATAYDPSLRLLPPKATLTVEVSASSGEAVTSEDRRQRPSARSPEGIRTIVLDPGHGGEETGAVGSSGTQEADLTLRVGRALKRELERRLPVKVLLTRTHDVQVPHDNRTAIANHNKADLFISLHFNSTFGPWAHGAETYFLSREASDELAAEAAAAENRSIGDDSRPDLDLQLILWDLAQSFHLAESQRFANLVQEELNLSLGLRDRGVKQAPFRVLMGAKMPAVLVELGFLSNPEEEAKLRSPAYVKKLVDSLVRAVIRFKTQMEARQAPQGAGP